MIFAFVALRCDGCGAIATEGHRSSMPAVRAAAAAAGWVRRRDPAASDWRRRHVDLCPDCAGELEPAAPLELESKTGIPGFPRRHARV